LQESRRGASIFLGNRHSAEVRNASKGDILKVWLYVAAVVTVGAWLSPLVYNAGKALAEVTAGKPTNGVLRILGGFCRTSGLPDFFVFTLMVVGLVLFYPFFEWLEMRRGQGGNIGQPIRKNRRGFLHWVTGFLLVTGLFLLTGYALLFTGAFVWRATPELTTKWWIGIAPCILLIVPLQEWLFRGMALGIFLRGVGAMAAITLAATLFGFVHFIFPPAGMNVPDPDASGVGFELLQLSLMRLRDPWTVAGVLVPMIGMGWILGYARWRTASLWLPAGLHAGWVFANGIFLAFVQPLPRVDPVARVLAGGSLAEGLIPLAAILITGTLIYFLTNDDPASADEI